MSDTPWPQMDKGRPVPGTSTWAQPPRQPPPAARPGDPTVLDASLLPAMAAPAASDLQPKAPAEPPKKCLECGGDVDADGYCTQCGAKAPSERDHFEETPAAWVGGVCDRGVKHARNEDALATAADATPGSRAVLVVCDGVTTSTDSDVAALAAARAARVVLFEGRPEKMGTPASRNAAVTALFTRAVAVANDAVAAHTTPGGDNPAACTIVAAYVLDDLVHAGNVGDSRAYWFGDADGEAAILTADDSLAAEDIASGTPRKQAEESAGAHTITRWLGIDATDVVPHVSAMHIPGPGWVLVCSDGLWNYASAPEDLKKIFVDAVAGSAVPVDVARALVKWAIGKGGHDNISAAVARVGVVDPPAAEPLTDGDTPTTKIVPISPSTSSGSGQAAEPVGSSLSNPVEAQPLAEPVEAQPLAEPVEAPGVVSTSSTSGPPAASGYDPITHQPIHDPGTHPARPEGG